MSNEDLHRTLLATCKDRHPEAAAAELQQCVLDAAHTYARGLETFEQSYPLAPIRVLCGAEPDPASGVSINCR